MPDGDWKNSGKLCKPTTAFRVCIIFESSPNLPSEVKLVKREIVKGTNKSWNTSEVYRVKSVTTVRKLPITQLCHKSTFLSKNKITN